MNDDPVAERMSSWNTFRSDLEVGRTAVKDVLEGLTAPVPEDEVVVAAVKKSDRCEAVVVRAIWDLVDDGKVKRVDDDSLILCSS
jgi:hypothetical protein